MTLFEIKDKEKWEEEYYSTDYNISHNWEYGEALKKLNPRIMEVRRYYFPTWKAMLQIFKYKSKIPFYKYLETGGINGGIMLDVDATHNRITEMLQNDNIPLQHHIIKFYIENQKMNQTDKLNKTGEIKKTPVILITNPENIFENFQRKTRNIIRKAIKNNITIRGANEKDIDAITKIREENNKENNLPKTNTHEFFSYIINKKWNTIIVAERENKIIAGIVLLESKNAFHYAYPFVKKEEKNTGVMSLLVYEATKICYAKKKYYFDLSGIGNKTEKERNIAKFKLQFNPEIIILKKFTWVQL